MQIDFAAVFVIGFLVLFGGASWYWIFFRMDEVPIQNADPPDPIIPLTASEIMQMEAALKVKLPRDYAGYLTRERPDDSIDATTVLSYASVITEATKEYREGFAGLKPWPDRYVYVGDEADACPYALDTESGRLIRTDKGNFDHTPLAEYDSFAAFVEFMLDQYEPPD